MNGPGSRSAWVWLAEDDVVNLRVRLSPKGGRDSIEEVKTLADGRQVLTAKVRAIPAQGQANAALEKLIARAIGIAPGRVAVSAGKKDRIKTIRIAKGGTDVLAAITALPDNQ